MSKYSPSFKREVVEFHRQGPGIKATAAHYGLDQAMVRRWVDFYRHHGSSGLAPAPWRVFSGDDKLRILKHMAHEGLSHHQAAVLHGIRSNATIALWQRQYDEGGIEALQPRPKGRPPAMPVTSNSPPSSPPSEEDLRTREALLVEIDYLRAEVAYLKKLEALVQADKPSSPRKKRR